MPVVAELIGWLQTLPTIASKQSLSRIGLHTAVSAGFCVQWRLDIGAGLEARNVFPAVPDFADASFDAAT